MAAISGCRVKRLRQRRKDKALVRLAGNKITSYIAGVNYLTRPEQMFLIVVLGLLLTGWAVKTYRAAHPPMAAVQPVKP